MFLNWTDAIWGMFFPNHNYWLGCPWFLAAKNGTRCVLQLSPHSKYSFWHASVLGVPTLWVWLCYLLACLDHHKGTVSGTRVGKTYEKTDWNQSACVEQPHCGEQWTEDGELQMWSPSTGAETDDPKRLILIVKDIFTLNIYLRLTLTLKLCSFFCQL